MIAGDRPYRAMDKKSYCNIVKIVLFLSLTLGMLSGILRIFNYKETGGGGGWQRFYQMDEECADVFFSEAVMPTARLTTGFCGKIMGWQAIRFQPAHK